MVQLEVQDKCDLCLADKLLLLIVIHNLCFKQQILSSSEMIFAQEVLCMLQNENQQIHCLSDSRQYYMSTNRLK